MLNKIDLVKVKKMFELEDELQKKLDDSLKHSITEGENSPDLLQNMRNCFSEPDLYIYQEAFMLKELIPKVDNHYRCIKEYSPEVRVGDTVIVDLIYYLNSQPHDVWCYCGSERFMIEGNFFGTYFEEIDTSSIDSMLTMTKNETQCDCGSWTTYGKNIDLQMHASWCSIKK